MRQPHVAGRWGSLDQAKFVSADLIDRPVAHTAQFYQTYTHTHTHAYIHHSHMDALLQMKERHVMSR